MVCFITFSLTSYVYSCSWRQNSLVGSVSLGGGGGDGGAKCLRERDRCRWTLSLQYVMASGLTREDSIGKRGVCWVGMGGGGWGWGGGGSGQWNKMPWRGKRWWTLRLWYVMGTALEEGIHELAHRRFFTTKNCSILWGFSLLRKIFSYIVQLCMSCVYHWWSFFFHSWWS